MVSKIYGRNMAYLKDFSLQEGNVEEFDKLDPNVRELIQAAIEVRKRSYSPYSKFKVGAAIRTIGGEIITGCNVENSSYSAVVCAERSAICQAISEGHREFREIAIIGFSENSFISPCGVCRQFIFEFSQKDITIYIANPSPLYVMVTSIHKLLPHAFGPGNPNWISFIKN